MKSRPSKTKYVNNSKSPLFDVDFGYSQKSVSAITINVSHCRFVKLRAILSHN